VQLVLNECIPENIFMEKHF